jgi:hypothetical protein
MLKTATQTLFIGCTESPNRREKLRREIEQETKEFLANGNTIKPVKNNLQHTKPNKKEAQK